MGVVGGSHPRRRRGATLSPCSLVRVRVVTVAALYLVMRMACAGPAENFPFAGRRTPAVAGRSRRLVRPDPLARTERLRSSDIRPEKSATGTAGGRVGLAAAGSPPARARYLRRPGRDRPSTSASSPLRFTGGPSCGPRRRTRRHRGHDPCRSDTTNAAPNGARATMTGCDIPSPQMGLAFQLCSPARKIRRVVLQSSCGANATDSLPSNHHGPDMIDGVPARGPT